MTDLTKPAAPQPDEMFFGGAPSSMDEVADYAANSADPYVGGDPTAPDAGCYTLPNGDCIGGNGCMHNGHRDPEETLRGLLDLQRTLPLDESPLPVAFITGVAGTGKTYLIRSIIAKDPEFAVLCATTGIAAVNLNTVTINSLLKFFDTDSLRDCYAAGFLTATLHKIGQEYDNICLDEVSMMDGRQLDILYKAIGEVNEYGSMRDKGRRLGLILTGDFCLHPDTKVMRADGSLAKASEIKVGDMLMGPGSSPRKVLRLFSGKTWLYKVKQTNGDDYIVTGNHLIALRRGPNGSRLERWGNPRYPELPSELFVSADNLSKTSRKFRETFVGYKEGRIVLPSFPVTVDPYFLGLWLGDGDKDCTRITTADQEIIDYCRDYASAWRLECKVQGWGSRTKAKRVALTTARKRRTNPLLGCLRAYGVIRNKHIPAEYLKNSEKVRLQLLAGLLDSDGSWSGNRFVYCSTLPTLAAQVKQLADGLGFRTSIYPQKNSWIVGIGGKTWTIPTKVKRKQSKGRDLGRSRDTSVLLVERFGYGDFCGFEIDGDRKFLLADGTVTHNCQLPPVKAPWVFESEVWEHFQHHTIRLTKVWRQNDNGFLDALNLLRSGNGHEAAAVLKDIINWKVTIDRKFDGTTIVATNKEVERHNWLAIQDLPGEVVKFPSKAWGTLAGVGRMKGEWKNIPEILELKIGAYVMILANLAEGRDTIYANGDCGHVIGVDPKNKTVQVKLVRNNLIVNVSLITRDVATKEEPLERVWDPAKGAWDGKTPYFSERRKRWIIGGLTYVPLRLAYAATVHKTQGLTLDRIQIDCRAWFFGTPAMAYVSLSRARDPKNVHVVGTHALLATKVAVDEKVRPWL